MGLDAWVYCDCFEHGRLRAPAPPGCSPYLDDAGGLQCGSDDLDTQIAFDRWHWWSMCEHEFCQLVAHRIGNIALVALLRDTLAAWPERFPDLLGRVLYSGTHTCDFIPAGEVARLLPELDALARVSGPDAVTEAFLREFERQMRELVEVALRLGKPIVF